MQITAVTQLARVNGGVGLGGNVGRSWKITRSFNPRTFLPPPSKSSGMPDLSKLLFGKSATFLTICHMKAPKNTLTSRNEKSGALVLHTMIKLFFADYKCELLLTVDSFIKLLKHQEFKGDVLDFSA